MSANGCSSSREKNKTTLLKVGALGSMSGPSSCYIYLYSLPSNRRLLEASPTNPAHSAAFVLVVFPAFGISANNNHSVCALALVLFGPFFLLYNLESSSGACGAKPFISRAPLVWR
jgi:hypothetical protein